MPWELDRGGVDDLKARGFAFEDGRATVSWSGWSVGASLDATVAFRHLARDAAGRLGLGGAVDAALRVGDVADTLSSFMDDALAVLDTGLTQFETLSPEAYQAQVDGLFRRSSERFLEALEGQLGAGSAASTTLRSINLLGDMSSGEADLVMLVGRRIDLSGSGLVFLSVEAETVIGSASRDIVINHASAQNPGSPGRAVDLLDLRGGDDVAIGGADAEIMFGGSGADRLTGGFGMDTIDGGEGADTLDGGAGFDVVSYASATAGVGARLDGGVNFGAAAGDALVNFEALEGSRFADTLVGSNANNIIRGGAGADRLFGSFGSDLLAPGDPDGADTVDGGAGFDWLDFTGAGAGVGARLDGGANFGAAAGDRYVAMEAIEGSGFGDVLIGSAGANVLKGNGGADRLFGLDGRDGLYGGAGDDALDGGAGGDLLDGGDGFDAVSYATEAGFVGARLDGGANWGAATGDVIRNAEALIGSRFNDRLIGNAEANAIEGGAGSDWMWGLGGADRFVFAGPGFGSDIVKDFQNGVDLLDFSRHAGVNGVGDLAIFDVGAFVRIDAGADRVFLEGATFADIEASDFLFA